MASSFTTPPPTTPDYVNAPPLSSSLSLSLSLSLNLPVTTPFDPIMHVAMPSSSPPPLSTRRRSISASSSSAAPVATLSSALTEERLRDFNSRGKHEGPSPYYRGLTDSALALRDLSPGRETYATATTGARSLSSTVLVRFQEWGTSCFCRRRRHVDDDDDHDGGKVPKLKATGVADGTGEEVPAAATGPDSKPLIRERAQAEEAAASTELCGERKPLRECAPAPTTLVAETWEFEKLSRQSESTETLLGPPPASSSVPAAEPPEARKVRAPGASSRKRAIAAPSAATATATTGGGDQKERAFVWADRYRPRALEDFICNRGKVTELRDMLHDGECDHFIFEGPPGVGKKTMISALLREVFGPENSETKDEVKEFKLQGEVVANIQANVKTSSQHIEINLSELRGYERHVVVALIKGSPRFTSKNAEDCNQNNCRAIVLYEADKLSTDSQNYIRWLMEKHKACFKIIFCCSDASQLQPIKHLCKVVELQPPSHSEIVKVLQFIAKNEGIDLPHKLAEKIADKAKQNLRQAIRSFEASWRSSYPFKENQDILTGWEEDIANIAKSIIEEQSPRQLYSIREKLKKLIEHNVSPQFIFSTLQVELKKQLDGQFHSKLEDLCEEYKINDNQSSLDSEISLALSQGVQENTSKRNNDMRSFMTIEEFTAKFMSFYKSNVVKRVER